MEQQYVVRFTVPTEVSVRLVATDEDAAADLAWTQAQEHLQTLMGDHQGVTVNASLDGLGADTVTTED